MNRLSTIGAGIAAVSFACILAGSAAQTPPAGTPAPRQGGALQRSAPSQSADTPTLATFQEGMERSGRALRSLKKSAFDASTQAADLGAIQSMQSGLLASKGAASVVPMSPAAKAKFGDDQTAYQTALRRGVARSLQEAVILELAVLDGKSDAAKAALATIIEKQEKGHELFQDE
jgi:hypothetical protein